MKKLLLFLVISLFSGVLLGQQNLNRLEKMPKKILDPAGTGQQEFIIGQKLSEANIGTSMYDLQTYGSISQRIYAYPDGTIAAIWMMAFETAAWSDRGAGYNYFDGSQWGTFPTERLETIRTGWPSYAPVGVNGEAVVSHALPDVDWVILFNKRENKGQGDWIETAIAGPEPGVGIVWPAMVSGGTDHNNIHLLALSYGTPYMDQAGALLYSRSIDGGETWDIQNHYFDELGYEYIVTIDAEGYAWAEPQGNTIAFSVGFDSGPGCIMKSTDNGETWEFIEVYQCPLYPPPGPPAIDFGAGDGSQDVAIDSEGIVHLVYGRMVYQYNDLGELLYYPATEGVIYWNESMPMLDSTIVSSYTLDFLIAGGNLAGQIVDPGVSGIGDIPSYFASLTSHPQMLIDESDRIFVLWDGAAPGYVNGTKNYRHIYGNSSNDNGLTWNGIVDFNNSLLYTFSECVFPAMAPLLVDNEFHFWFQNDGEPGIFVWAASQTNPGENNITHMSRDASFLTDVKANHNLATNQLEVSQNFPNPFEKETFIEVSTGNPGEVTFLINDLAGRIIHAESFETVTKDKFRIHFVNNDLSSGIYYYTIHSESGTFTGKMVVK